MANESTFDSSLDENTLFPFFVSEKFCLFYYYFFFKFLLGENFQIFVIGIIHEYISDISNKWNIAVIPLLSFQHTAKVVLEVVTL